MDSRRRRRDRRARHPADRHELGQSLLAETGREAVVDEEGLGLAGDEQVIAETDSVQCGQTTRVDPGDKLLLAAIEDDKRERALEPREETPSPAFVRGHNHLRRRRESRQAEPSRDFGHIEDLARHHGKDLLRIGLAAEGVVRGRVTEADRSAGSHPDVADLARDLPPLVKVSQPAQRLRSAGARAGVVRHDHRAPAHDVLPTIAPSLTAAASHSAPRTAPSRRMRS